MARIDCVFIRKSTQAQDDEGQKANVSLMLKKLKVQVPAENWVVGTVQRRKVKSNAAFNKLLDLITNDRVGTVYIESQDRWGTADRHELFSLLHMLREHDTRLFDLRAGKDIAEKDLASEMMAFINSIKSEKELQDLSYRSLRTRISNFKERATWPNGTHPFGYGKQCVSPEGILLWEWHPTSRVLGQVFTPNKAGKLVPGPENVRLPRKDKRDLTRLIPSRHKEHVESVQLIFDLFTRGGLSRRQISTRMNAEGREFYDKPFTHSLIGLILNNPAYAGHIHFGKTQTAAYNTFDANGGIVEIKKTSPMKARPEEERLVARDAHEPLISKKDWELTQKKMAREGDRKSFPARNSAYYLKPLLVCGHCGKNMSGRTEIHPSTKERIIVYFCSSYLTGRQSGIEQPCGAHRITHATAEQLLFEKLTERGETLDDTASKLARKQLNRQLEGSVHAEESDRLVWWQWVEEGSKALVEHLKGEYDFTADELDAIRMHAKWFYRSGKQRKGGKELPIKWADFSRAIRVAEKAAVERAAAKVEELKAKHTKYTKAWIEATEMQREVIREETVCLEEELKVWEPRLVPISRRLKQLDAADTARTEEREQLIAQWPKLEHTERAEALRQVFHTVTLYWDAEFHEGEKRPGRPRKTERAGRYSYTLSTERINWEFAFPNVSMSR